MTISSKKITSLSSTKINDNRTIVACRLLLLILYTGRPLEMIYADLTDKKHRLFKIEQDVLNIELPITKLRIKQKGVDKVLNNQSTAMMLYLPKKSVSGLAAYPLKLIKFSDIQGVISEVINKAKEKLNLPLLSLGRIQSACYTLLVRQFGTEDLANIITARNAHKSASLYYLSQQTSDIQAGYNHMMTWLFNNQADAVMAKPANEEHQAFCIGSQNSPTINIVRALMQTLCQEVQSSTTLIDGFNAYNLWLWHVCLLLTSMRAVEGVPGFLHQLNFESSLIWVSDKEERIDVDSSRLIPMCNFF